MYSEEVEYEDEHFYDPDEEDEEDEEPHEGGIDEDVDDDDDDDDDEEERDVTWQQHQRHRNHRNRAGRIDDHDRYGDVDDDEESESESDDDLSIQRPAAASAVGGAGGVTAVIDPLSEFEPDDPTQPQHQQQQAQHEQEMEGQLISEQDYEPSDQEILEYCEWLGMDTTTERQLMWIAREALKAPLPENWKICYTEDREVYYFNVRTGESIWDHPMDAYYKALFKQEKAKLDKKKRHMRMFSGGLDIKPLADFFSEEADPEESDQGDEAPWANIPDSLTDAIDFKIFIDPVVLPTSGRTVSRHTIINNKWRDPFTREYVENRRLVPNVDKRNEVDAWLNQMVTRYVTSLTPDGAGMKRMLKLLPFMVDKEDEVCVRGQKTLLSWMEKDFFVPAAQAAASVAQLQEQQAKEQQQQQQQHAPAGGGGGRQEKKSAKNQVSASSKQQGASKGSARRTSCATTAEAAYGGATTATNTANTSTTSTTTNSARGLGNSTVQQGGRKGHRRESRDAPNSGRSDESGTAKTQQQQQQNNELTMSVADQIAAAKATVSKFDNLLSSSTTPEERHSLVASLLTMSSSSSRELLLNVMLHARGSLSAAPQLLHPAFLNFSDEVMNVLHLSPTDLMRTAAVVVQRVADVEAGGGHGSPLSLASSSPLTVSDITMTSMLSNASTNNNNNNTTSASMVMLTSPPPRPAHDTTAGASQQQQQQQRFASLPPLNASTGASNSSGLFAITGSNSFSACDGPEAPGAAGGMGHASSLLVGIGCSGGAAAMAPYAGYIVQNSDHVTNLHWVHLIAEMQRAKHDFEHQQQQQQANTVNNNSNRAPLFACQIFAKLDFVASTHLVVAMCVTPAIPTRPCVLNTILRGIQGWPSKLNSSPDEHIRVLTQLALDDAADDSNNNSSAAAYAQVAQLHDVLFHGGERHIDAVKRRAGQIASNLRLLASEEETQQRPRTVAVDMFGALAVFNEIVSLECFKDHPTVLLRIGSNLGPRLTRSQWKPKHFHETVSFITSTASSNPVETWNAIGSKGVLFLTRELSKKKSNSEENRSKLETIEAIERQMQQSNAISNWGHLASRLLLASPAPSASKASGALRAKKDFGKHGKKNKQLLQQQQQLSSTPSAASSKEDLSSPGIDEQQQAKGNKKEEEGEKNEGNASAPTALVQDGNSTEDGTGNANNNNNTTSSSSNFDRMKLELQRQRAANYVSALNILLLMRLKPKQRPVNPSEASNGSGAATGERSKTGRSTPNAQAVTASSGGNNGNNAGRKQSAPTTPMQDASRAPQRTIPERKPPTATTTTTNSGASSSSSGPTSTSASSATGVTPTQQQRQLRNSANNASSSSSSVTLPPI